MSRLLCCACRPAPAPAPAPAPDMGAALSQPHVERPPPTMAIVIRERKKKAGSAGLGTLRRRLAAAARRPNARPDRGCEHARFIRSVVSSWRLAEVWLLSEQLEALSALRDLQVQAELAREPAPSLGAALAAARLALVAADVEVVGAGGGGGWALPAHRALLAARSKHFQHVLHKLPPNTRRVPLCGPAAHLSLEEMEAVLHTMYTGAPSPTAPSAAPSAPPAVCSHTSHLDILGDSTNSLGSIRSRGELCACAERERERGAGSARRVASLAALLGVSPAALHQHMRYLLDSREFADARLVWASGGPELPCHRFVLAARSRFFRGVMTRREGGGGGGGGLAPDGVVCVDDKVLPQRFARALLHAAYTDQVDLTLVGRPSSPTGCSGSSLPSSPWSGSSRAPSAAVQLLDDAFQLYEIGRFLEMPIVVQGCEDAIVEALTHETLGRVLQWAAQVHASQWVHRQAARYLRDEFPAIMSGPHGGGVPRAALREALASPFLQASEAQALRALLRWGAGVHQPAAPPPPQPQPQPEPNVVWHTAHSWAARGGGAGGGGAGGGGGRPSRRRRDASDAALREVLAPLVCLVRLEHLPPSTEILQQALRRGIVSEELVGSGGGGAAAWLGRGVGRRPARCFLPYLDELRALLAEQRAPPELASLQPRPIPDTLYMVAAARAPETGAGAGAVAGAGAGGGGGGDEALCVPPRLLAALRARVAELHAAPPAQRAARLPQAQPHLVHAQIALRAVRERSLPDACCALLPAPPAPPPAASAAASHTATALRESYGCDPPGERPPRAPRPDRELDADPPESGRSSGGAGAGGSGSYRRDQHRAHGAQRWTGCDSLSARVPDVAMAPNANTHLLTHRDYHPHPLTHPHPLPHPHPLQLDLGDGAAHPPAPGSRALRAHVRHRDYSQGVCLFDRLERAEPSREERSDELRAAIELSVIRAYSSFAGGGGSPTPLGRRAAQPAAATLPHSYRADMPYAAGRGATTPLRASPAPALSPAGAFALHAGAGAGAGGERSPRLRRSHYRLDYRLDAGYSDRDRALSEERRSSRPPSPTPSPSPRDYA